MPTDLWGLTSRPEHPSSPHFTRDDVEMAMLKTITAYQARGRILQRWRWQTQARSAL